ncbi:MAG: EamA family transporter [Armatimonadota bacterium]
MNKPSLVPVVMIFINIILGSAGQLLMKYGTTRLGALREGEGIAAGILDTAKGILTPHIFLGISLYAVSAIIWLRILRQVNLSFAYPMISFSYVVVVLLSALILKEKIPGITVAGLVCICAGVSLIGIGYGSPK